MQIKNQVAMFIFKNKKIYWQRDETVKLYATNIIYKSISDVMSNTCTDGEISVIMRD